MKRKEFTVRLQEVVDEASAFIKKEVKVGKKIVFLTDKEMEEDQTAVHDVAAISKVGKHGDYTSYAILSIEGKKQGAVISVISRDEDESRFEVALDDLGNAHIEDADLCFLADMIDEKINK